MKKLAAIIVFALVVYYFVFSNKDKASIDEAVKQIQVEDRALDYDIKYKDTVEKIDEAVKLNLEQKKSMEDLLDNMDSLEEKPPE